MIRTFKFGFILIALMVVSTLAIINYSPSITIASILIAIGLVFYFVTFTNGLYTDYAEGLNSDVDKAIVNVANLIHSSTESVKIVSATLSPAIYSQPEVFTEIEKAINRHVKIKVLIYDKEVPYKLVKPKLGKNVQRFKKIWYWAKTGNISVSKFSEKSMKHFMIVDRLHTRVEEKHPVSYYPDAKIQKRRAKTHFLNPKLAGKYLKEFDQLEASSVSYFN